MTKRWSGIGLVLGLAVVLHGCESHPTDPVADASVDAAISGVTSTTFEGTGEFYATVAPPSFRLVSRAKGSP